MGKLTTLWTYFSTPRKFKSRAKINNIQEKGMAKQVKMVRRKSKFFAQHWDGIADKDWRKFPLVNKEIMMENLQEYLTEKIDVKQAFASGVGGRVLW